MFVKKEPVKRVMNLVKSPTLLLAATDYPTSSPSTLSLIKSRKIIDHLILELSIVVMTKKTDPGVVCRSLSKYTEDTIPFELLNSPNSVIRRLTAVLIALIFEQKSDVFRYKLKKTVPGIFIDKYRIYLRKKVPDHKTIKIGHPQYLATPVHWSLADAFFPRGVPTGLMLDRLEIILMSKDYLCLPDPKCSYIWMNFESQNPSLPSLSSINSSAYRADIPSSSNSSDKSYSQPSEVISDNEISSDPSNKNIGTNEKKDSRDDQDGYFYPNEADAQGFLKGSIPHKIKVFKFYRKSKNGDTVKRVDGWVTNLEYNSVESSVQIVSKRKAMKGDKFRGVIPRVQPLLARQGTITPQNSNNNSSPLNAAQHKVASELINALAMKKIVKVLMKKDEDEPDINIINQIGDAPSPQLASATKGKNLIKKRSAYATAIDNIVNQSVKTQLLEPEERLSWKIGKYYETKSKFEIDEALKDLSRLTPLPDTTAPSASTEAKKVAIAVAAAPGGGAGGETSTGSPVLPSSLPSGSAKGRKRGEQSSVSAQKSPKASMTAEKVRTTRPVQSPAAGGRVELACRSRLEFSAGNPPPRPQSSASQGVARSNQKSGRPTSGSPHRVRVQSGGTQSAFGRARESSVRPMSRSRPKADTDMQRAVSQTVSQGDKTLSKLAGKVPVPMPQTAVAEVETSKKEESGGGVKDGLGLFFRVKKAVAKK